MESHIHPASPPPAQQVQRHPGRCWAVTEATCSRGPWRHTPRHPVPASSECRGVLRPRQQRPTDVPLPVSSSTRPSVSRQNPESREWLGPRSRIHAQLRQWRGTEAPPSSPHPESGRAMACFWVPHTDGAAVLLGKEPGPNETTALKNAAASYPAVSV